MPDLVIQRVIFPEDARVAALYHARPAPSDRRAPRLTGRRTARVPAGGVLSTESYFNCFFEAHWRRFTSLDRLALRLRVGGAGRVELYRRLPDREPALLAGVDFAGEEQELLLPVPGPRFHFRELGAVYFEVRGGRGGATLHAAEWLAVDARPAAVGLVAGYCTFNRERYLLEGLRRLADDPEALDCLRAVVVVDQGTNRVTAHPDFVSLPAAAAARTRIVEQGNFGGAGGFTRSILEAQGVGGASHVLLMDDDAVLEPESVFRAARFLALARGEVAVGGNMLDLLRANEVFEVTAEVLPQHLAPQRVVGGFPVDRREGLTPLLDVHTTRYNGWWFMAFPLSLVERLGLPLPFFIRCDDMEWGCRLNRAGVPIVPLPGVGVWHEPFYLKWRGWQNYYELRNMLALCALHFPQRRGHAPWLTLRRLLHRLLAHDYAEAWLLCEAVADYCRGPEVLEDDPRGRHARLTAGARSWSEAPVPAAAHLPVCEPAPPPPGRLRRLLRMGRCLLRQVLRASPRPDAAPGHAVRDRGCLWWSLAMTDVAAVQEPFAAERPVYRRSRARFLTLLGRGLLNSWRLWYRHHELARRWGASFARLTAKDFWHGYLGLGAAPDGAAAPPRRDAA